MDLALGLFLGAAVTLVVGAKVIAWAAVQAGKWLNRWIDGAI